MEISDEERQRILQEFEEGWEKTEKIIAQIREERLKEHELVMKMTDEEQKQYLINKYKRVNEFAEKNGLKTKSLTPNQDFTDGKDFDAKTYLEEIRQKNLAKMAKKNQEGGEE